MPCLCEYHHLHQDFHLSDKVWLLFETPTIRLGVTAGIITLFIAMLNFMFLSLSENALLQQQSFKISASFDPPFSAALYGLLHNIISLTPCASLSVTEPDWVNPLKVERPIENSNGGSKDE